MQPVLNPRYSLVIPVYRNSENIGDLVPACRALHDALAGRLEVIFVVDGSPDDSHARLAALLPSSGLRAQLISLSRNFGSFAAVRAGLAQADGRYFAVMAADLQEPPGLVVEMFDALETTEVDVVVGVRAARQDPALQRWQAQLFWAAYRRWVVPQMPAGGVDVFACNRVFRDALLALEESRSSLIAQIFWLGFRRAEVSYVRQERQHGSSAWSWQKKISYMADSVFAFTDLPIRALLLTGSVGVLVATALGALALAGKVLDLIAVPGYAMTMLAILFFGALNLLSLGIVGSYAWRAYENTKGRPQALVLKVDRFFNTAPKEQG